MMRICAALAITTLVVSCGPAHQAAEFVNKVATAVTAPIVNPLGPVDIYRVKNVYAAGLQLAVDYRAYCWSKSYAAILADPVAKPVCQSRRAVVRSMQASSRTASRSIASAETFIRNNPTGNAVTYVTAAWDAVQAFRSSIPTVK